MKRNMGLIDRVIRVVLAAALVIVALAGKLHGALLIILLVVAAILLLTGLVGYCGLYVPLKISTNKKKTA